MVPPLALTAAASRVPSRLLNTRSSGLGVSKSKATVARGILILFSSRDRLLIPRLDVTPDVPIRLDGAEIMRRDPKVVGSGFIQGLTRDPGGRTGVEPSRFPKSGSSSSFSGPWSTSIATCAVGAPGAPSGTALVGVPGSLLDASAFAICALSASFDAGLVPPGVEGFGTGDDDGGFEGPA